MNITEEPNSVIFYEKSGNELDFYFSDFDKLIIYVCDSSDNISQFNLGRNEIKKTNKSFKNRL